MSTGRRYTQSFVNDPSCCPSRASMMTGRYPHNNGVLDQQAGPQFPSQYSLACYFARAGYATYIAGKFLTTWPKTQRPPCFDHSTVIWGGYNNVAARTDGVAGTLTGYNTTSLGVRGREYVTAGAVRHRAVPPVRDPAGPALGQRHDQRHHDPAGRPGDEVRHLPRGDVRRCARAGPQRQAGVRAPDELHDGEGADDVRQPDAGDHVRRRPVRRHDAAAVQPRGALATPWSSSPPTTGSCGASTAGGRSSRPTSRPSGRRSSSAGPDTSPPGPTPPGSSRSWTSCPPCWRPRASPSRLPRPGSTASPCSHPRHGPRSTPSTTSTRAPTPTSRPGG